MCGRGTHILRPQQLLTSSVASGKSPTLSYEIRALVRMKCGRVYRAPGTSRNWAIAVAVVVCKWRYQRPGSRVVVRIRDRRCELRGMQ